MKFRISRIVSSFFLICLLSLSAAADQKVLWEHDFTSSKPSGKFCQGTFQQGKGLLCDKGYYNLSIPLLIKSPVLVEITASRGEKPVALTMLLVHTTPDGKTGTFKSVADAVPLAQTPSARTFYLNDPAFSGAGKVCSLYLYRVHADSGRFGAGEPVLLRHLRISEAAACPVTTAPVPAARPAVPAPKAVPAAPQKADYIAAPCSWNAGQPASPALRVFGDRISEDGIPAVSSGKNYVMGILQLNCAPGDELTLKVEAKTTGHPASTLGVILYDSEKGLKPVQKIGAWQTAVKKEVYGTLVFTCSGHLFKKAGRYSLFLYRSNQKSTLFLRSIGIDCRKSEKKLVYLPEDMPDRVGPSRGEPSGTSDFHMRITGLDASRGIREIEVTNESGGRWVSGDDVKKNFYMIQYYDSADYEAGRNPRNNFDGRIQRGLSSIDLLMESISAGPEQIGYACRIHYEDGSKESLELRPPKQEKPAPPQYFTHDDHLLVARRDYRVSAEDWQINPLGGQSFWQLMSPPDRLKENFLMKGNSYRRIWSLGWFLPFTDFKPRPSKEEIRKYGIAYNSRVAVREVQIFDGQNRNLAPAASVSAQCPQGILNLNYINDGDFSKVRPAVSAAPLYDGDQTASFVFDFGKTVSLKNAVVDHGMKNGSALGWIARDFFWQYKDSTGWHSREDGLRVTGNQKPVTSHSLEGISCSALCLTITSQNGLYDYGTMNLDIDNPLLNLLDTDSMSSEIPFHFWYLSHEGILDFGLPDHIRFTKKDQYEAWKKRHPYFQGFQLVEFDNDLGTFLGWDRAWNVGSAKRAYDKASRRVVVYRDIPPRPRTREEAVELFHKTFMRYSEYSFGDPSHFLGISIWNHHGLEWGARSTVFENCGGSAPVMAMQVAAARGASRQYGNKPWGYYMANYLGGRYLNYHATQAYCGPHQGKSASLYRRQLYLTYLGGGSYVDFEHPDLAFCYEKPVPGREPRLTPHGKAVAELYEFNEKHPDRGIPYTPVALLMDWTHGWRHHEATKIFMGNFQPTLGDRNIDAWMNGIFGLDPVNREGYGACMGMTGFSGLTDILILNPPSGTPKILNQYKVAILAGDIRITPATAEFLKKYVADGGTLVINVEQLKNQFREDFTGVRLTSEILAGTEAWSTADNRKLPEKKKALAFRFPKAVLKGAECLVRSKENLPLVTRHAYGRGQVILTLQKYLVEEPESSSPKQGLPTIHYLLSLIRHEALPMTVTGDMPVELLVNRLKDGWRVSCLNNQGVYKNGPTPERIDQTEIAELKITMKEKTASASALISGKSLKLTPEKNGTACTVRIPAGDVEIIDFR